MADTEDTQTIWLNALKTVQKISGSSFAALMVASADGDCRAIAQTGQTPPALPDNTALRALTLFPPTDDTDSVNAQWLFCGKALSFVPGESASPDEVTRDHFVMLLAFSPQSPCVPACMEPLENFADVLQVLLSSHKPHPAIAAPARQRLPGRDAAFDHINAAISGTAAPRAGQNFGLLRITLDKLEELNERVGWEIADSLIDETVSRVTRALPADARLTYFGGGTMAVVTPVGMTATTTRTLVQAILVALRKPASLPAGSISLSCSVGWALFPQDGDCAETLDIAARAALAEVRRQGGDNGLRASKETLQRFRHSSGLEQDLQAALMANALTLNWMPIIQVASQQVVGLEALLRWNRPGHGAVPPALFIRAAEDAGMIEQLDAWVLRHACETAATWPTPLRVCVNVSPVWLASGKLAALVSDVLSETGLEPARLQIELSEGRPFGPKPLAHQEMSRLRALGVRIALDDFGTGFASLERLSTFPVDQIKLDRAFLVHLQDNPRVREILRCVLQLALNLSVSSCVKGVETERQRAFLEAYGCEELQGYLLGAPVAEYPSLAAVPIDSRVG